MRLEVDGHVGETVLRQLSKSAVRLTCTEPAEVHVLTNNNSIDMNLGALVAAKQALTKKSQDGEDVDMDEELTSTCPRVSLTGDKLAVLSYPGPDRSVRLEQLRAGRALPRRYRNRRIGEFLKELKFTEGRATGIPKILRALQENGSPPPEFEFDEDHSYFMVRLPVHPTAKEVAGSAADERAMSQVTREVTREVHRLLSACRGSMARRELQDALAPKAQENFRALYLAPALEDGLIEMTIPDRPRSSRQKYRLTDKGQAYLKSLESR